MAVLRRRRAGGLLIASATLLLLLALSITGGTRAAAQAMEVPWKQCGLVHLSGKNWIRAEAKTVGCRKALRVTRVIANRPGYPTCDTATHCQIEGFSCEIENQRKKVICIRGEARIRMRPARQD